MLTSRPVLGYTGKGYIVLAGFTDVGLGADVVAFWQAGTSSCLGLSQCKMQCHWHPQYTK